MTTLSRRAALLGGLSALTCGCAGGRGATDPSAAAASHWSVRFTGVPPNRIIVHRDHYGAPTIFDVGDWTHSYGGVCVEVSAADRATTTREIFSYPGGEYDLTVYRGIPPNVDPRVPSCIGDKTESAWWLIGRAPSGVIQYGALTYVRLFVLPDGTWIFTNERVSRLLGPALAADPRPPPLSDVEPTARLVQQDLGADHLRLERLLPQGLFAREAVVGRSLVQAFGPAPGNRGEGFVKFHYSSEAQARAATDDLAPLLRSGAARDRGWTNPLPDRFVSFMRSVSDARADGRTLVLRGQF